MYQSVSVITNEAHKTKAIKKQPSLGFAKELSSVIISIDEYFEACKDYIIVFAKDNANNWYASIMLGVETNKNLFVDENGLWEANKYIPAFVRRYPFIFAKTDDDRFMLSIDEAVLEDISIDNKDDQIAIFDDNSEPSEYTKQVLEFMNSYQLGLARSKELINDLEEWGLLEQKNANIEINANKYAIDGFYIVNEEKFAHLSEDKKAEICKKGATAFITAHLISLSNLNKLPVRG